MAYWKKDFERIFVQEILAQSKNIVLKNNFSEEPFNMHFLNNISQRTQRKISKEKIFNFSKNISSNNTWAINDRFLKAIFSRTKKCGFY